MAKAARRVQKVVAKELQKTVKNDIREEDGLTVYMLRRYLLKSFNPEPSEHGHKATAMTSISRTEIDLLTSKATVHPTIQPIVAGIIPLARRAAACISVPPEVIAQCELDVIATLALRRYDKHFP